MITDLFVSNKLYMRDLKGRDWWHPPPPLLFILHLKNELNRFTTVSVPSLYRAINTKLTGTMMLKVSVHMFSHADVHLLQETLCEEEEEEEGSSLTD